jgi:hypothetical protein
MSCSKIQVLVRLKGLNEEEKRRNPEPVFEIFENNQLKLKNEEKRWKFDFVVGEEKNQEDIYKLIGEEMLKSFKGGKIVSNKVLTKNFSYHYNKRA